MKVLNFNLYIENKKIDSDLISKISEILNCKFEKYNGDKRHDEEVWETELFGLEFELAYSYELNEINFSGNSEKIAHYMPENEEREFTDISEEVFNIFSIFMPDIKWKIDN